MKYHTNEITMVSVLNHRPIYEVSHQLTNHSVSVCSIKVPFNETTVYKPSHSTHRTKSVGLMSIRYRSDAFVSDLYLININPRVFAIWVPSMIYPNIYLITTTSPLLFAVGWPSQRWPHRMVIRYSQSTIYDIPHYLPHHNLPLLCAVGWPSQRCPHRLVIRYSHSTLYDIPHYLPHHNNLPIAVCCGLALPEMAIQNGYKVQLQYPLWYTPLSTSSQQPPLAVCCGLALPKMAIQNGYKVQPQYPLWYTPLSTSSPPRDGHTEWLYRNQ